MTKMTKKRTVGEAKQSRGMPCSLVRAQGGRAAAICRYAVAESRVGQGGKDPKLGHVWESQIVHVVHVVH